MSTKRVAAATLAGWRAVGLSARTHVAVVAVSSVLAVVIWAGRQ
jgi:hypothetical protein